MLISKKMKDIKIIALPIVYNLQKRYSFDFNNIKSEVKTTNKTLKEIYEL